MLVFERTSSVVSSVTLKDSQKTIIHKQRSKYQKIYLRENLAVTVIYFCYGRTSLMSKKANNFSLNNHFLATTKTVFMAVNKK